LRIAILHGQAYGVKIAEHFQESLSILWLLRWSIIALIAAGSGKGVPPNGNL
jgi:hypothetical protein